MAGPRIPLHRSLSTSSQAKSGGGGAAMSSAIPRSAARTRPVLSMQLHRELRHLSREYQQHHQPKSHRPIDIGHLPLWHDRHEALANAKAVGSRTSIQHADLRVSRSGQNFRYSQTGSCDCKGRPVGARPHAMHPRDIRRGAQDRKKCRTELSESRRNRRNTMYLRMIPTRVRLRVLSFLSMS